MTENSQAGQQAKPSFIEWFNPHDIGHIKAYRQLQKTGAWPIGFFPAGVKMNPGWQASIAFKLARAWVDQLLEYDDYVEMCKEEAENYEVSKKMSQASP